MLQSELCPWCGQHPDINAIDGGGAACCEQAQDAEQACEVLEASDAADDRLVSAAVTYWPDLVADRPTMRQRMTHERMFSEGVAHG
jgi:hypothetical protein